MAKGKKGQTLVAFESGHYLKIDGHWVKDGVWSNFKKNSGGIVHVNREKVEYIENFSDEEN